MFLCVLCKLGLIGNDWVGGREREQYMIQICVLH